MGASAGGTMGCGSDGTVLAAASSSWCSAEAAASSGIAGGLPTGRGAGGG